MRATESVSDTSWVMTIEQYQTIKCTCAHTFNILKLSKTHSLQYSSILFKRVSWLQMLATNASCEFQPRPVWGTSRSWLRTSQWVLNASECYKSLETNRQTFENCGAGQCFSFSMKSVSLPTVPTSAQCNFKHLNDCAVASLDVEV